MKVKLINVAEYDVKEETVTSIPFENFKNLCGVENKESVSNLPSARLFKSIDEFRKVPLDDFMKFNKQEQVRLLPNGQFIVFLNNEPTVMTNNNEAKTDATTNTKTNKEK